MRAKFIDQVTSISHLTEFQYKVYWLKK